MNAVFQQKAPASAPPAFGTVLAPNMAATVFRDGKWEPHRTVPTGSVQLSPAAHVLHYCSSCFEGFKAYRWADGSVNVFRMQRHIERMRQSAQALVLPEPDPAQLEAMIRQTIEANRSIIPEAPGALYVRPLLFGTTPNIGAAATPSEEAQLLVLASPVWDYFAGGGRPLKIFVDDHNARTGGQTGHVKTGGNYAAALGVTLAARRRHGTDQVLFCPNGEVQETGAANFLLLAPGRILTRALDSTFLHGVTRDSLLTLAREQGYQVEERILRVEEMLEWVREGEAALSGTAAVLAGVGTLVYQDREYPVGGGVIGPVTSELRLQLVAIQRGEREDSHGWVTRI